MPHSIAPLLNIFSITRHKSPYPGLRPFGEGERDVFFGRDSQIREVIERLRANHFAAILGGSGSGKSSLVRAGVIPDLRSHALPGSDHWLPIIFTPGEAPIERLAERLQAQLALADDVRPGDVKLDIEDLLLQTRPFARFLERFQGSIRFDEEGLDALGAQTNLLVVVDQFEEIFRPQTVNSAQAKALVRLIIETFQQPHPRVYLVLTMRTEFLDHCAGSLELPDVLNATSYLTRRLNRAELEEVIVEPAKRYLVQLLRDAGQKPEETDAAWPFAPAVKRMLLNDVALMSDDTDHLPLLQHCLYRLWKAAEPRWQAGGHINSEPIEPADLDAAVGVGGSEKDSLLRRCLANHGDAIYRGLTPARQKIAAEMFKLLAEVDEQGIHKRRWTTPQEIKEVTGADLAVVDDIVRKFSDPHPYIRCDDAGSSPTKSIDVSHESFIRNWRRFRQWLEDDRALVECYEKLLTESQDWQQRLEEQQNTLWRKFDRRYLYRLDRKLIDRFVENNYIQKMVLPWARRHYASITTRLGNNYKVDDTSHGVAISFFNLSRSRRNWQRFSMIGGGFAFLILLPITYMMSQYNDLLRENNRLIGEERRWLDIETQAFQPYAISSAIVGPATREREGWRPTRLWQAAVALRALEKLEKEMPELQSAGELRQYRLERAQRLAHSVSIQAVRDIAGSTVWPVAAVLTTQAVAESQVDRNPQAAALSMEDQACVDAVLAPAQRRQPAELVRAGIDGERGVPLVVHYREGNAYNLAFGFQRDDTCFRVDQTQVLQDVGPDPVFASDLGMIVVSKEMTGAQTDEQVLFSIHRLNWYPYCEPRTGAPCRQVWRTKARPPVWLSRDVGAIAGMGADGRSFFVQSDEQSREWFRIAEFDGAERLTADEALRISQQFQTPADAEDAFDTVAGGRRLVHHETGRELLATPAEVYEIVAHAEAGGHLAIAYSGTQGLPSENNRQAADNSLGEHFFTILRVGEDATLKQRIQDNAHLNLMSHPVATFDFFGPPIEQIVFGSGVDKGLLYFRTEGDFYYRLVWGTSELLQSVCTVLGEAGLEQPVVRAFSPTFKMFAGQEGGTVWQIVAEEKGPCPL